MGCGKSGISPSILESNHFHRETTYTFKRLYTSVNGAYRYVQPTWQTFLPKVLREGDASIIGRTNV
jgi:hypothetical protein